MPYLTVKESAQIAGRNERTIRRWIKAGKVKYTEIKGKYHVEEESLGEYINEKAKNKDQKAKLVPDSDSGPQLKNPPTADSDLHNANRHIKTADDRINRNKQMRERSGVSENGVGRQAKSPGDKIRREIFMSAVEQKAGVFRELSAPREGASDERIALREGVEYEMSGQLEKVSENKGNNMSAKILSNNPIVSNSNINQPGEMSVLSTFSMSDLRDDANLDDKQKTDTALMSDFTGHLPTHSDGHVDKFFDRRGIIGVETPFFPDNTDTSEKMSVYSDKIDGHINRTFQMSAYATRLIEEKERVAKKFEEQNDFLKGELTELRKEISALREVVAQESKNRANTGDFLMESNRKLQDKVDQLSRPRRTNQHQPNQTHDYQERVGTYGFRVTYDDLLLKNFYYMIMGLIGLVVFGVIVMILLTFWA